MKKYLSVTTAASTIDLTTVETIRDEIGNTTLSDSTIRRWIGEESDRIAAYCGRVFGAETVVETFYLETDVPGLLMASRFPIVSVSSVSEDDAAALDASLYQVDATTGFIYRLDEDADRSVWSADKVAVSYTAGYTLVSTLPRAVEAACIQMVARRAYARGRDPNLRSESVDGVSTLQWWVSSDSDGMTAAIREMLAPYRQDMAL